MARKNENSESSTAVAEPEAGKPNQSAFIRDFLAQDTSASYADIARAWGEEGNDSKLNNSLFYQIRGKLGLTKARRAGRSGGSPDEPNRSEYIRKNLLENPDLSASQLTAQWNEEGFSGELTPSLFYQVKRRMGLSTKRGSSKPSTTARKTRVLPRKTNKTSNTSTDRQSEYSRIERTLDSLIGDADQIKDTALATALRQARRVASAALV